MSDWSNNDRACTTLWTSLYTMKQISRNFEDSGVTKMSELAFFNPLASSDLLKQEAMLIAEHLDQVFVVGRGAKYKDNVTSSKAIEGMINILIDENKQVSDLASNINTSYNFWGS
jgi:hypothetical protein